jgi:hypothetical protein
MLALELGTDSEVCFRDLRPESTNLGMEIS